MKEHLNTLINVYLKEHKDIADNFPKASVIRLVEMVFATYKNGGEVFVMGNGGGADHASHFASDLGMHPFVSEDKSKGSNLHRLQVHCLNDSNGLLTRIANDMGYHCVFVEQLKCYCPTVRDLVIAFSVSGNSPNIVDALEYSKICGATTCCIGKGGKARDIVNISIEIPGSSTFPGQVGKNDNYFHIEDFQGTIAHMVTGLLKEYVNG